MGLFGRKKKNIAEEYDIESILKNAGYKIEEYRSRDIMDDGRIMSEEITDDAAGVIHENVSENDLESIKNDLPPPDNDKEDSAEASGEDIYKSGTAKLEDAKLGRKPALEDIRRYIDTAGSRIAMMNSQNDTLRKEYESVTGYLTDIQIVESVEGTDKTKLLAYARDIIKKEDENKHRSGYERDISDSHYKIMQMYEDTMNRELVNMKKKELYQTDIKNDMKYLEEERERLLDEQEALLNKNGNIRSISIGGSVLIVSLMILLGVLWSVAGQDMTLPYIAVIFLAGILVLYIFMGMRKGRYDIMLTDKKLNKCINLLNSVKIKYVNNTALLDYMCSKYNIANSVELENVWQKYIRIRENEDALSSNKEELIALRKNILEILGNYNLQDVSVWEYQARALLDNKEMVEVRHSLNVRRQKLRKQIGYNDDQIRRDSYIIQKFLKKKPQLREIIGSILKKYSIEHIVIKALRQ